MESASGLRRRRNGDPPSSDKDGYDDTNGAGGDKQGTTGTLENAGARLHDTRSETRPSARPAFFCSLFLILASYAAVRFRKSVLADGGSWIAGIRGIEEKPPMALFNVDAAMRHVEKIAAKPRWIGSKALDESLKYIEEEIAQLKDRARHNGMTLEVELFHASGSYAPSLATTDLVVSYRDIPAVIARLSPADYTRSGEQRDSLLVAAHVDSAAGSPGGSDNVAAVGISLEALRCLTETPPDIDRIFRPVIFLFNGAEEAVLAGAHGFMTSHRWASTIAAHINLESMGPGDAYILFQVGPLNSWLARVYAKAVAAPLASTAGMDVFESKLIPAETDFRVFKEFGIPGFDFATIENGCIYHTRYDDVKHVSANGVLYGGKALVLPLIMELAGTKDAIGHQYRQQSTSAESTYDKTMKKLASRFAHALPGFGRNRLSTGDQRAVYFDVLGLVTIVFDENVSIILNWGILWVSLLLWSIRKIDDEESSANYREHRLRMLISLFITIFAAFASGTCAALFYEHVLQRPLSWNGSSRFALALYAPCILVGATLAMQHSLPTNLSSRQAFDCMLFAVSMIYAFIVLVFSYLGMMTAFLPATVLISCMLASSGAMSKCSLVTRTAIVSVASAVFGSVTSYDAFRIVLGLMGRIGTAPAEIILSLILSLFLVLYLLLPLASIFASRPQGLARIRGIFLVIAVFMAWVVWILPELTLPHRSAVYSKDAPKRIVAVHFHSPNQSLPNVLGLVSLDLIPVDVNTTVRLLPFSDRDSLQDVPVWGVLNSTLVESFRLFEKFLGNWTVFAVDERVDLAVPKLTVVDEIDVNDENGSFVNVTLAINAPDSFQISTRFLDVKHGGYIKSWSMNAEIVDMGDGEGCWLRHIGSGTSSENIQYTVMMEKDPDTGRRGPLDIDVTSMRLGKSRSRYLQDLYFPLWTAPLYVQTTGISLTL